MRFPILAALSVAAVVFILAAFVMWPEMDLLISGLFANHDKGFYLVYVWPLVRLSEAAYWGARVLGLALAVCFLIALCMRRPFLGLSWRAWFFLFGGLLLGPGLIANGVFKDNWGRARPREVVAFGGTAAYSPPLVQSAACEKNCSFVSGDAAFGFFLTSFAYVVPKRRSRKFFWGGVLAGVVFGGARVISGAHFLSDVLFAAFFMLVALALWHGIFVGWKETAERWRLWFDGKVKNAGS